MSLTSERPATVETELLIPEARERSRRRWVRVVATAAAVAVLAGAALWVLVVVGRATPRARRGGGVVAAAPRCDAAQLRLGPGEPVSPPTEQAPLLLWVTNVSRATCTVRGYPAALLVTASGAALGVPTRDGRDMALRATTTSLVTIPTGQRAYFGVNQQACVLREGPTTRWLRVTVRGGALTVHLPPRYDYGVCPLGGESPTFDVSPFEARSAGIFW